MANQSDLDSSPYRGLAEEIRHGKSPSQIEYEQRPPQVSITYRKAGKASSWRFQHLIANAMSDLVCVPFQVELDGVRLGRLLPGETLRFDTTTGEHQVRILGYLSSSRIRKLKLENGQKIALWCHPSMSGIIFQLES